MNPWHNDARHNQGLGRMTRPRNRLLPRRQSGKQLRGGFPRARMAPMRRDLGQGASTKRR